MDALSVGGSFSGLVGILLLAEFSTGGGLAHNVDGMSGLGDSCRHTWGFKKFFLAWRWWILLEFVC